jgi:hypothetical protein
MVLDDMRMSSAASAICLVVRDLRISLRVDFERCLAVSIIVGGIDGWEVEFDNELVQTIARPRLPRLSSFDRASFVTGPFHPAIETPAPMNKIAWRRLIAPAKRFLEDDFVSYQPNHPSSFNRLQVARSYVQVLPEMGLDRWRACEGSHGLGRCCISRTGSLWPSRCWETGLIQPRHARVAQRRGGGATRPWRTLARSRPT